MPKVTFIVGLPGSGKTHLAERLTALSNAFRPTLLFDDIGVQPSLLDANESRKRPLEIAEEEVHNGKDLFITDPWLCLATSRADARAKVLTWGTTEVEFLFFENNPEACLQNAKDRNDGRNVEAFIRALSKQYVVPSGVLQCRVYDKGDPDTWQNNFSE